MHRNARLVGIVAVLVALVFGTSVAVAGGGRSAAGVKAVSCSKESVTKSRPGNKKTLVPVTFQNDSASTVNVYWLDYAGARVLYATLTAGQGYVQDTYDTHAWVVTDATDNCLSIWVAGNSPGTVTIS